MSLVNSQVFFSFSERSMRCVTAVSIARAAQLELAGARAGASEVRGVAGARRTRRGRPLVFESVPMLIPVSMNKKTLLRRRRLLGRPAFTAPNRGEDRSFLLLDCRARPCTKSVFCSQAPVLLPMTTAVAVVVNTLTSMSVMSLLLPTPAKAYC